MRAAAIQFPVTMNVPANLAALERAVGSLKPGCLAVAPEGALSGYEPVAGFVERLNSDVTAKALEFTQDLIRRTGIHLVVGACLRVNGIWRNSAFCFEPDGTSRRYDKINLAQSERGTFEAGNALPIFDITVDGLPVRLGIQMCREIRYPEQWRYLSASGAQIIAYVNNAVGSRNGHEVWRAHAISRAAETQRFVIGANNAAADQTCPTLIVSPSGEVLSEAPIGSSQAIESEIDLSQVSNWVIGQARSDVVDVVSQAEI